MVSFTPAGRMGNFLFECATAFAYSLDYNIEFTIPHFTTSDFHCPIYLHHLKNNNWNPNLEAIHLWENGMPYQLLEYKPEWAGKNIIIEGYRQSEKYFYKYRNEIISAFNYPYEFRQWYVSVHVRRTDYLTLVEKHPPVTKEWYETAMKEFDGFKFKFFSDDILWCEQNFGNRSDCEFSHGTIESDLYEASWCEHNICSASTYSWWQMYLNQNPNKKVIFPSKWFVDGWSNENAKDVLPDYVIKMPNL